MAAAAPRMRASDAEHTPAGHDGFHFVAHAPIAPVTSANVVFRVISCEVDTTHPGVRTAEGGMGRRGYR